MSIFKEEKISKDKLAQYASKVKEKFPTLTSIVRELYLPTKTNLLIGNLASLMGWMILRGQDKFFSRKYVSEYSRYNFLDLVLEGKVNLVDAVNLDMFMLDSNFDPEAEGTSLYQIFAEGMAYLDALQDLKVYDQDMYMVLYMFDSYLITYFNSPKVIAFMEKQGFNYFLEHKKVLIAKNW